jgi:hypothetical protein
MAACDIACGALPTSIGRFERVIVSPARADFFACATRNPAEPRVASAPNCMLKLLYNRDPAFLKKRQHLPEISEDRTCVM